MPIHNPSFIPRPQRDLYPEITPYSQGFFTVDDVHTLYWEQCGNPDGVPILVVHGGPGIGATPTHRRFFDPAYYRIIIYDQRGAGRSHPIGNLANNTLAHLVADIEALRNHFGINRWHLFGGSWGSTLSLAYAIQHPEASISLILRGIFLMEQAEVDWFMHGMGKIFPESHENFANFLPDNERGNLLQSYYARLTGEDDRTAIEAALNWYAYESACVSFIPKSKSAHTQEHRYYALAAAKIEAHYFMTQVIKAEDSLLGQIDKIRHIPASIIHGRYDIVCPIENAYRLHLAWPEADYVIVPDAGHSSLDPSLRSRLIEATDNARSLYRGD